MRCPLCASELAYVHGHAACVRSGCPMFGVNQAECCSGETAGTGPLTVDVAGGQAPAAPACPPRGVRSASTPRAGSTDP